MTTLIRSTPDAYVGLEAPSAEGWRTWYAAMLDERARVLAEARFDDATYRDASTAWSDRAFRQLFLFMYDTSFFDAVAGDYRTSALVESWRARFGRVDEVVLWHAYPRLGFDSRTQFDFYRDMPGGLGALRREVCDVLHASGIRVLVDYNPWDAGTHEELADVVAELGADGVMLDTMTDVPVSLASAIRDRSRGPSGVVFSPELRPSVADLQHARQSWAQWYDVGDARTPSIYRHRWLVPRHRQFAIARWDASRQRDIAYAFFNGAGLVLWENVFGTYHPYTPEDRRLIVETAAIFDAYEDLFAHGTWLPLVPTGVVGLDANRFVDEASGRAILTLRNRKDTPLAFVVPDDAPRGLGYVAFWEDAGPKSSGDSIVVPPGTVRAIALDDAAHAATALGCVGEATRRLAAQTDDDRHERRRPRPRPTPVAPPRAPHRDGPTTAGCGTMIDLPGGSFVMEIRHERRECGCYALGTEGDATWGWHYQDTIAHAIPAVVAPFAMRRTAVTNEEFLAFVHASGYRPTDPQRFLSHVARRADRSLPRALLAEQAELPVTYVSLADARAFATFHGERLPTEAEWQWAAEGAGAGRAYPWGDDERSVSGKLAPADERTATPQGVLGLSSNAWELTESEHTDGHTRFVMLRGGAYLPPGTSEWLVARGARPNRSHAKYLLLADGLDRSEAVSFRTVRSR